MNDFAYARAASGAEAVAALADDHAAVLAGGTELLNWVRLGITAPERVVDIGGLDELRGITRDGPVDGGALRIGALTTLNEIGEHPLVVAHAGALASACLQAASAQIRNRATLGGNVLQRTRCAYFRAEEPVPWPCNRRAPGSGCAARHGLHERHAIFGWTDECVAVQPSDPAVALAALDAEVDVVGPAGPRTIPSTEFHLTPQEAGLRENRLDPDELIVGYRIPLERDAGGQAYVKIRERASYEYAIVSAAAAVRRDGTAPGGARLGGGQAVAAAGPGGGAAHPRSAAARRRTGHGRRRAAAPQRVQGDHGSERRGPRPAHRRRCAMTVTRIEAADKLTGAARFAADHRPEGVLHAVLVGAPVATGTLRAVDAAAARALPGVTSVLTAADLPDFPRLEAPAAVLTLPFTDDRIPCEGWPVAIVLGESVEAAEAGRAAVALDCAAEAPVLLGAGERSPAMGPDAVVFDKGDVDAARAQAAVRVEQTYLQAARHHNTMETSGTVARWDGDRVTLWDAVQASSTVIPVVSAAFGIDPANVRVVSPHTGGGFGAKGYIWPHEILAAAAARVAGRPVKLHLRRADQFSAVGYQPWMEQTIRLAADAVDSCSGSSTTRSTTRAWSRRTSSPPPRRASRSTPRPRSGCGRRSSGSASTCRPRCGLRSRGPACGRWRAR